MPRPTSSAPTDGELEILNVLWEHGPTELGTVCAELRRGRPVATTTVATMLKIMMEKALVKRAQGPRGYQWSARVTAHTTKRKLLRKLIKSAFDGSVSGLVAHLIEDGKLQEDDLEEIRRLIEEDRT